MFKVQLRQHLLFIRREIIIARMIEIPIAPFPGLEIELLAEEGDPWNVTIKHMMVKSSGLLVAHLEWWPEGVLERSVKPKEYLPGEEEAWTGFHVIWDDGRDFVGEDY